jgi:hypothetical protein
LTVTETAAQGDENSIQSVLSRDQPVSLSAGIFLSAEKAWIVESARAILAGLHRGPPEGIVSYIVGEIIDNAQKALFKRVHFLFAGLDIDAANDYRIGMETFLRDYLVRYQDYAARLKELGISLEVSYRVNKQGFVIAITNSGMATPEELRRISDSIRIASTIRDPADAFVNDGDHSEGNGIGIIHVILMLRSLGVGPEAFSFQVDPARKQTGVQVILPLEKMQKENGIGE